MQVRLLIIFIAILCLAGSTIAQEVHRLDLPKCLEIAALNNYDMRTLRLDLEQAEYRLTSTTNRFKTQVNMYLTLPSYTETVRQFEDSLGVYYKPIEQFNYTGNLEISQPLPTDGRLFLRSGIYGLQDYDVNQNTIQLNTRLGFEQPIEALYSYNNLRSSLRESELSYERSHKRLTRAELDLKYNVSSAFYNLVAVSERQRIARQTLNLQRESTTLAQNKYKAGVIAEVEALQMEIDLAEAENNFDIARAERAGQENQLKQLLGIPLRDSLSIQNDLEFMVVHVDLEKAIDFALTNRLEIREYEIQKELADIEMRRTRLSGHITGTVSAYYDFIGVVNEPGGTPFSGTLNRAWQTLKDKPGNRGVSLTLRVPIWDWGVNSANVQAARVNLVKSSYSLDNEKVRIEREIRNTVAQLKSSQRRSQLLQKSIKIADKSFNISQQRFANGEINSQALALDRTRLSTAYLSHIQAYISYKLLLLDLARKTFFDFEEDKSLVK